MKISVILAHADRGSFNHAIAQSAIERLKKNGYNVFFHDLYGEDIVRETYRRQHEEQSSHYEFTNFEPS